MARFRKARRRSFGHFKKRSGSRRGSAGSGSALAHFGGGMGYGFVRTWISDLIKPLTSKIPMGDAADNIGMGLLLWQGKKYVSNPMARRVMDAGLAVEGAMLGEELKSGSLGIFGNKGTTTTTSNTGYPV